MPTSPATTHESFDPTTDQEWEQLRALGHRMLDELLDAQRALPHTPAWRPLPADKLPVFSEEGPRAGMGADAVYDRFRSHVLPYGNGNWHPRFFGWVQGNGTPLAMLADMIASGMNPHLAGFNQAPALVEQQVIGWLAEWMGIPGASGLFVTGGTMANVHGLAAARYAGALKAEHDVRSLGVQAWPGETRQAPLVFYGSSETHGWAYKAAEWLGLGRRAFRQVPVHDDFTVRIDALEACIAADRAAGLQPFAIVGTAGTVNTGAIDDLQTLADIAARESLWFHVDGAFGALLALAPSLRDRLRGMERADSLGFDLHKWGSMPFECACVLVRDPALHEAAFRQQAAYLGAMSRGVSAGGQRFNDRGLDLTRGFKALKVWMQLQADGVDKFGRIIEQNVRQVQRLVAHIDSHDELERLAPAPLNVVCFRYCPAGATLSDAALDALNTEILQRLQERGIATPSSTIIHGRFALRVAHVNHRTTLQDIDEFAEAVVEVGRETHAAAM
ncbi:MAG TPA: pyridoxal-dependent decarboxylase [Gemmatimonas sp.]|uniref:pyridoxal phosphate-dependent decarboxylase family protein n=1 Tax=Gemmatimonas sp. TaxID=1962908 RepID=UPI002ED9621E